MRFLYPMKSPTIEVSFAPLRKQITRQFKWINMHAFRYDNMFIYIYIYVYVCVYIYTYMYVYIYIYICIISYIDTVYVLDMCGNWIVNGYLLTNLTYPNPFVLRRRCDSQSARTFLMKPMWVLANVALHPVGSLNTSQDQNK